MIAASPDCTRPPISGGIQKFEIRVQDISCSRPLTGLAGCELNAAAEEGKDFAEASDGVSAESSRVERRATPQHQHQAS